MDNNFIGKTRLLSWVNAPSVMYLVKWKTKLGEEWKETILDALIKQELKCVSPLVCHDQNPNPNPNPPNHPRRLNWEKTKIETEQVKKWLAGLPDFDGQFKDAPPRLTPDCILKRIGEGWDAELDGADLPTYFVTYASETLSGKLYNTADVVAWLSSLKPASPVESSLSERPADTGNSQKLPLALKAKGCGMMKLKLPEGLPPQITLDRAVAALGEDWRTSLEDAIQTKELPTDSIGYYPTADDYFDNGPRAKPILNPLQTTLRTAHLRDWCSQFDDPAAVDEAKDSSSVKTDDYLAVIGRLVLLLQQNQKDYVKNNGRVRRSYTRGQAPSLNAIWEDIEEVADKAGLSLKGCGGTKTRSILSAAQQYMENLAKPES